MGSGDSKPTTVQSQVIREPQLKPKPELSEEEIIAKDSVKLPVELLRNRLKGCLWAAFIGDALSMPVHWYYNPNDIDRQFGKITDFMAASEDHPGSVMQFHSTGKGGRGEQQGSVVGDVILHGKKEYWGKKNIHYHRGMQAGENTLNLQCTRVVLRSIVANEGKYDSDKFLEAYIKFMTTPGNYNDTYAESYHRDFFHNWSAGKPPRECSGPEAHDTPSIGAFVTLFPVILLHHRDRKKAKELAVAHLRLTHNSNDLDNYARLYVDLLLDVLHMTDEVPSKEVIQDLTSDFALKVGFRNLAKRFSVPDREFIGNVVSSACYISGSFPAMCYLVGKYADSVEQCLLGNTNAGGENCHRGACCGTLVGAIHGYQGIPERWIQGLLAHDQLVKEINSFVEIIVANEGGEELKHDQESHDAKKQEQEEVEK